MNFSNVFTLLYALPFPSLISVLPPTPPHPLFFCLLSSIDISFTPPFSVFGSFPSSLPICPLSHSLFSSSSSAAECCPSYLCSRLGMFFLLMTSILSLPLHHFLFSVWAAHLPRVSYLSLPTHLDYCRRFIGGGGGVRGSAVLWLAKEQPGMERASWDAWCCLAGEAVHLFVHSKQLLGDGKWS